MWFCAEHKRKHCSNRHLYIGDTRIQNTNTFTYLGAMLDSTLTMTPFLNKTVGNTNFLSFKFGKLRYLIGMEDAKTLFKQAIVPHFDNCSFITDCSTETNVKKLQVIQNRMLRCIQNVRVWEESITDLHELCEIPLLAPRRKELLMSLIYSKSRKDPPINTRRRTRNDNKMNYSLPFPRTQKFKRSPLYRGLSTWNKLPFEIQSTESKLLFKRKIKKLFGTYMKGKNATATARRARRRRPVRRRV